MLTRTTLSIAMMFVVVSGAARAQDQPVTAPAASTPAPAVAATAGKAKKAKDAYSGPTSVVVLPPTPLLDVEGKQVVDTDGKPVFNPPMKQIRDKKGHPVFDDKGKPVFETATSLGYDERGKKIPVKKVKTPKMTPVSITRGTLTVDGWTGKARLNYDIRDFKYMYIYAPGIGTAIVSHTSFPGAKEQANAFDGRTLTVTVDGHPMQIYSDKLLLGKKPSAAWVAVDRNFALPSKFPVFGYGAVARAPYVWPGSKEDKLLAGQLVAAPELPKELKPALLLSPCPAGMMREAGPAALPGTVAKVPPCIPIKAANQASTTSAAPVAQTP